MFKPCPKCGFLVALIAGREASQRCPRCGSALVEPDELTSLSDAPPAAASRTIREPRADREDAGTGGPARPAGTGARDAAIEAADMDGTGRSTSPPDGSRTRDARDAAGTPRAHPHASRPSGASDGHEPPAAPGMIGLATAPAAAGAPAALSVTDAAPEAPAFARRRPAPRARERRWPWWAAVAGLALLLALQLLLAQRSELAADARWRPTVASLCAVLGCTLPPWREPAAFAMLARNVRPHPDRGDVLRATTTVRNDARWPQPLPVVVLNLSDVDGRIVGTRAVPPRDYSRTPAALVAPGTSVDIAFDVREPAPRVVSFDFRLE